MAKNKKSENGSVISRLANHNGGRHVYQPGASGVIIRRRISKAKSSNGMAKENISISVESENNGDNGSGIGESESSVIESNISEEEK